MPTFYLVDHSLKDAGGHHFDYALQVLRVAEQAGYDIVLATHRGFHRGQRLPNSWDVVPVFQHRTYSRYCASNGWRGGAIGGDGRLLAKPDRPAAVLRGSWCEPWSRFARSRRIRAFARSCLALFDRRPLAPDDHVFIPTLSEFDLLGLSEYLRSDPQTLTVDWHLQFHFGILEGRECEYPAQAGQLRLLSRQFESALSHLPDHRLHFYTTTEQLARQYDLLNVATFTPLPYPINDDVHPPRDRSISQPLRMSSVGAVRKEKGQRLLSGLVEQLWADAFETGQLQIAVQCKPRRFSRAPRAIVSSRRRAKPDFHSVNQPTSDPIVYMRHPLPTPHYLDLIHQTDIGLLLYDSHRYYARHAGVLGEYLSAGIPVIVPAGCWLSEQITDSIQSHLEELCDSSHRDSLAVLSEVERLTEVTCDVPAVGSAVMVGFIRNIADRAGTFAKIIVEQHDRQGAVIARHESISSVRSNGRPTRSLFHLHPASTGVRVLCTYAYVKSPLVVDRLQVSTLAGNRVAGGAFPAGRVGLIAATEQQVPDLVRDMMKHYEHYQRSARGFSSQWHAAHRPTETFQALMAKAPRGTTRRPEAKAA